MREPLHKRMGFIVEQDRRFKGAISYLEEALVKSNKAEHHAILKIAQEKLNRIEGKISEALQQKNFFSVDENSYLVENQIDSLAEEIRGLKELLADVAKYGNYQTPSLDQSHVDQGFQRGTLQYEGSDLSSQYLRFSAAPENLEAQLHQLVRLPQGTHGQTFLYGSGMGALSSITGFALSEVEDANRKMAVGASGYFETQVQSDMWKRTLPAESIITFDEHEVDGFEKALDQNPQIILTEHVVNTEDLVVVPIEKIVAHPHEGNGARFIIVDYTMSGPLFDISKHLPNIGDKDILVLITSLQKLYQEGDDLVPAGMATVAINDKSSFSMEDIEKHLKSLRGVLGVNVPLDSIISLKLTNPDFVHSHAEQIAKNVSELADNFSRNNKAVENVYQPPKSSSGESEGMVFNIRFSDIPTKERFISKSLELAVKYGVTLSEGTSFGFRYTRMFTNRPPADDLNPETSIVRISPGIENERQVAVLKRVFEEAVEFLGQ